MCLENVGDVKVRVVCDRGTTNPSSTVTVHYKTVSDRMDWRKVQQRKVNL